MSLVVCDLHKFQYWYEFDCFSRSREVCVLEERVEEIDDAFDRWNWEHF